MAAPCPIQRKSTRLFCKSPSSVTCPPTNPTPINRRRKSRLPLIGINRSARFSPLLWGINDSELYDPKRAADAKYQKLLGDLDAPFIRLHHAGSSDDWTNAQTRDWDVEKIKASLNNSSGYGDAKIMVNIANWPGWLSKSEILEPDKVPEFAALCARLVKVMRDDAKYPVAYWEITNELDNKYEKAGKLDDLWKLYNAVAAAMRREDSTAKLGGPALTWAKPIWVEGFLKNCSDVQFVSWHNYGTGDLYETNADIYEKVGSNVGDNARAALNLVKQYDKRPQTANVSHRNPT